MMHNVNKHLKIEKGFIVKEDVEKLLNDFATNR